VQNLISDVAGLSVGQAHAERHATGVTVVVFDEPAVASAATLGGGPGLRDTSLLDPEMTVETVDAFVLGGGSAFGLDAAGGVMAALAEKGRGFRAGTARVPIVPQAILFDLMNGGDKDWGRAPPYFDLGLQAFEQISRHVALGTAGAGYGATTANLKGGIGSASAVTEGGHTVGAIVAVNAVGTVTVGDGPHFWAAPYETNCEFGGLGWPASFPPAALAPRLKGGPAESTTIAVLATDAILTKPQARRLALAGHNGLSRAIRPAHTPLDGDTVFAASTGRRPLADPVHDFTSVLVAGADCLARAIARAVFEATRLPYPGALPAWRERFGRIMVSP
jgi:L-aminopeptidase/D-esterase-like protein